MQFFNLSLLSVLAMTSNAAPTGNGNTVTVTPVRMSTTTTTVPVKQDKKQESIINRTINGFHSLSPVKKAAAGTAGAVATTALVGTIGYGSHLLVKAGMNHYKKAPTESEEDAQAQFVETETAEVPHKVLSKKQWLAEKEKLRVKHTGSVDHQLPDGSWSSGRGQNAWNEWVEAHDAPEQVKLTKKQWQQRRAAAKLARKE